MASKHVRISILEAECASLREYVARLEARMDSFESSDREEERLVAMETRLADLEQAEREREYARDALTRRRKNKLEAVVEMPAPDAMQVQVRSQGPYKRLLPADWNRVDEMVLPSTQELQRRCEEWK